MIIEVGVHVVERVNILNLSSHHRHCPGTAFEKDVVGAVAHHGRRLSDRSLCRPQSNEETWEASVSRNVGCPTFIWHELIWGRNHDLVTPHDHGTFVGIVSPFFSGTLLFETDFSCLIFWFF
jgi:hypothetical protein